MAEHAAELDEIACQGLVFIGDPHLSSRKPGRRTDKDYASTILGKLAFVRDFCNEHGYLAVFLGDMYDAPVERSESLKIRTLRLLRSFDLKPVGNVGNHDILNQVLTDEDSLKYLEEAGAITLATHSGALARLRLGDKTVGLGATPYGQSFPTDARFYFPDVDTIIWITHHDLALEDPYPGAIAPQPIKGCKLAVNGHMHLRKPILKVGETSWFNPGNIVRQAVDAIDHVPAVTLMTADGRLRTVPVPHEKGVFDLTGKFIDSISPGEAPKDDDHRVDAEGVFVSLLETHSSMEMSKSDDGSILMEDIVAKFDRDKTDDAVRSIILDVHGRSLEENRDG